MVFTSSSGNQERRCGVSETVEGYDRQMIRGPVGVVTAKRISVMEDYLQKREYVL